MPEPILDELVNESYVILKGTKYILTDKGLSEKNRLCTLAGLNILYSSEKGRKQAPEIASNEKKHI